MITGSDVSSTVDIAATGSGIGVLTATIPTPCGNAVINKTITNGIPKPLYIAIWEQNCFGGTEWEITFEAIPHIPDVEYIWVYNGFDRTPTSSPYFYSYESTNSQVDINLKTRNSCGTSSPVFSSNATFYSPCGSFRFSVFPNPASNELKIGKKQNSSDKLTIKPIHNSDLPFYAKLINNKGQIIRSGASTSINENIVLNTQDVQDETYYLHISEGKEVIKKQVIIKH